MVWALTHLGATKRPESEWARQHREWVERMQGPHFRARMASNIYQR
jgi:hypothetical protein